MDIKKALIICIVFTLTIKSMEEEHKQAQKKKRSAIAKIIPKKIRKELRSPDVLAAICTALAQRDHLSPELASALAKLKTKISYQDPQPFAQADALFQANNYDKAFWAYERLLPAVKTDEHTLSQARMNQAECLLAQGVLHSGFLLLMEREKHRSPLKLPWLKGQLDEGARLRIVSEQGIGDGFFFVPRFVAALKLHRPDIVTIVQARKPEIPLFKQCSAIDHVVLPGEDAGKINAEIYAMTLPLFVSAQGMTPTHSLLSIPGVDKPYMKAPEDLVEKWRKELGKDKSDIKIGIWWRASKLPAGQTKRMERDIPLADLAQLSKIPGVILYSLQAYSDKGGWGHRPVTQAELKQLRALNKVGELDELDVLPDDCRVHSFGPDFDAEPFADTAAVMENMALLIGCDTAQLCLAGALSPMKAGKKVIGLLPHNPDWRWEQTKQEDTWISNAAVSTWSPSILVLRQQHKGDWKPLIQHITTALLPTVPQSPDALIS